MSGGRERGAAEGRCRAPLFHVVPTPVTPFDSRLAPGTRQTVALNYSVNNAAAAAPATDGGREHARRYFAPGDVTGHLVLPKEIFPP